MNKDDGKEMPVMTSRLLPNEMNGVAIAILVVIMVYLKKSLLI